MAGNGYFEARCVLIRVLSGFVWCSGSDGLGRGNRSVVSGKGSMMVGKLDGKCSVRGAKGHGAGRRRRVRRDVANGLRFEDYCIFGYSDGELLYVNCSGFGDPQWVASPADATFFCSRDEAQEMAERFDRMMSGDDDSEESTGPSNFGVGEVGEYGIDLWLSHRDPEGVCVIE